MTLGIVLVTIRRMPLQISIGRIAGVLSSAMSRHTRNAQRLTESTKVEQSFWATREKEWQKGFLKGGT